jgi:hypothetical protein
LSRVIDTDSTTVRRYLVIPIGTPALYPSYLTHISHAAAVRRPCPNEQRLPIAFSSIMDDQSRKKYVISCCESTD